MDANNIVSSSAAIPQRLNAPPRAIDASTTLAIMTRGFGFTGVAGLFWVLLTIAPSMHSEGTLAQLMPSHDHDAVVESVYPVQHSAKARSWTEWEVTARVVDRPDVVAFGSLKSATDVGEHVHALVPDARPDLAVAWRDGRPPLGSMVVFPLLLLCAAGGLAIGTVLYNRRDLVLLRDGVLTTGTIIDRTERSTGKGIVWTLFFRYVTARDGEKMKKIVVEQADLERLIDEAAEPLLYDPARPERALLLDALPDRIRVTADGALTSIPWERGLLRLVPVVAAVAAFIATLVILQVAG
jgi:hypothetical protein